MMKWGGALKLQREQNYFPAVALWCVAVVAPQVQDGVSSVLPPGEEQRASAGLSSTSLPALRLSHLYPEGCLCAQSCPALCTPLLGNTGTCLNTLENFLFYKLRIAAGVKVCHRLPAEINSVALSCPV